jgi:chemotaxis protein MotB
MAKKRIAKGAPKWMATFADMSTLLMTFFVLMLSMANIDIEKFREMLGSVKNAFGVSTKTHGSYQAVMDEKIDAVVIGTTQQVKNDDKKKQGADDYEDEMSGAVAEAEAVEHAKQEQAVSDIKRAIASTDIGDMAEIHSGKNGIRVRVKGALLFGAGEALLKATAKPFLDDLVVVLKKFRYYLLVEGHTDAIPISTNRFPSNWELSGARASAVLRHLIESNIDPRRLTSVGLADNFPLATNSTSEGRAKNRRVEFIMTREPFRPEIN